MDIQALIQLLGDISNEQLQILIDILESLFGN